MLKFQNTSFGRFLLVRAGPNPSTFDTYFSTLPQSKSLHHQPFFKLPAIPVTQSWYIFPPICHLTKHFNLEKLFILYLVEYLDYLDHC